MQMSRVHGEYMLKRIMFLSLPCIPLINVKNITVDGCDHICYQHMFNDVADDIADDVATPMPSPSSTDQG